mgnify:CR=1 FL=1
MSDFRRNFVSGGTYFFTCVTYQRQPILTSDLARRCLRHSIEKVQRRFPFAAIATVLLPDHWHTVWQLPEADSRYPLRWRRIKEEFTRSWLMEGGRELEQTMSRKTHRHRGVWQKRYWEHTVRDERDLKKCVDYIHWNPRKHGLVSKVADWQWSSFHRFVAAGEYTATWGNVDPAPGWNAPEWGE